MPTVPVHYLTPDPATSKVEIPNAHGFMPGVLVLIRPTPDRIETDDRVLRWVITVHVKLRGGTLALRPSDNREQQWVRLGQVITETPQPGGAVIGAVAYFPDWIEGNRTCVESYQFVFGSPFADASSGRHPDRYAEIWFARLSERSDLIGVFPVPLGWSGAMHYPPPGGPHASRII